MGQPAADILSEVSDISLCECLEAVHMVVSDMKKTDSPSNCAVFLIEKNC
jgi:hypothetical protein